MLLQIFEEVFREYIVVIFLSVSLQFVCMLIITSVAL